MERKVFLWSELRLVASLGGARIAAAGCRTNGLTSCARRSWRGRQPATGNDERQARDLGSGERLSEEDVAVDDGERGDEVQGNRRLRRARLGEHGVVQQPAETS